MWNEEELKENFGKWIPCAPGTFPEDVLPERFWNKSFFGTIIQSFPVLYTGGKVTGWGIRTQFPDGSYDWDNRSKLYGHWKMREN